jgi:Na+/proline symporter
MRQGSEPGTRIKPWLILSHFLLAASGLVIWIIYVATDKDSLAWIAFVILALVAVLGWTMFAIWWQRRKRGAAVRGTDAGGASGVPQPAEQRFPVSIVTLHGILAVTTVVLVFLTAVGVGD